MGNNSSLSNYKIDENSLGQCGPWTLFNGHEKDTENKVSVFQAELKKFGQLPKHLERGIEALKRLRHPGILRYLHSEVTGESVYLFVEPVQPVTVLLNTLSELEICSGLSNVLQALDFIHTKANVLHNNVCKSAIFVTEDRQWKLGGFEVSCGFADFSQDFLDEICSHRYSKAMPPEDNKKSKTDKDALAARDLFAYGQLVKETITCCVESDVPFARDFLEIATKQLQNQNASLRGSAGTLASHRFFQQDLLNVENFFKNIALKSPAETEQFFRTLPEVLRALPEDVLGSKLSSLLLSRIVVLNPTAQTFLLPLLLIPRSSSTESAELFCVENFRKYILPTLSKIFFVRDLQVRLILLNYFPYFFKLLDSNFLREELLPEILLGIRDTNNELVAATLRVVADLVLLFGAEIIVGGKRQKLFADGKPKFVKGSVSELRLPDKPKAAKKISVPAAQILLSEEMEKDAPLPERDAPDGGEDTEDLVHTDQEEAENLSDAGGEWLDWDATEVPPQEAVYEEEPVVTSTVKPSSLKKSYEAPKEDIFDLSALEIRVKPKEEDFDFFADMQPTIVPQATVLPPSIEDDKKISFAAADLDDGDAVGWNWDD